MKKEEEKVAKKSKKLILLFLICKKKHFKFSIISVKKKKKAQQNIDKYFWNSLCFYFVTFQIIWTKPNNENDYFFKRKRNGIVCAIQI